MFSFSTILILFSFQTLNVKKKIYLVRFWDVLINIHTCINIKHVVNLYITLVFDWQNQFWFFFQLWWKFILPSVTIIPLKIVMMTKINDVINIYTPQVELYEDSKFKFCEYYKQSVIWNNFNRRRFKWACKTKKKRNMIGCIEVWIWNKKWRKKYIRFCDSIWTYTN